MRSEDGGAGEKGGVVGMNDAAAEGVRRFDDDDTVIALITPRLRGIVLHQAHDPHSQAKHLNPGDNA